MHLCHFYANWYEFVDQMNTEQIPQFDLKLLCMLDLFSKEIVANYISSLMSCILFGCVPHLDSTCHIDIMCKYSKCILEKGHAG